MDMAVLVDAQGEMLDNIETQVIKKNHCYNFLIRVTLRTGLSLRKRALLVVNGMQIGVECSRPCAGW